MPTLRRTGRLLTVAALAASTTLSGPAFAYAEEAASIRLAQSSPDDGAPADGAAGDQAPAEGETTSEPQPQAAPEPEPELPAEPEPVAEPAPEPEAVAPEPEAAPIEEPAAAAPAEEAAPAQEQAPEAPAADAPPADEPTLDAPAAEPVAPAAEEAAPLDDVAPAAEAAPEAAPAGEAAPAAPAIQPDLQAPEAETAAPEAPAADAVEPAAPAARRAAPARARQAQPAEPTPGAPAQEAAPQAAPAEGAAPAAPPLQPEPQAPAAEPAPPVTPSAIPPGTAPAEASPETPPAAPDAIVPATPGDGSAAAPAAPDAASAPVANGSTSDMTPAVPGQQTPEAAAAAQAAASVPPVPEQPTAVPAEVQNAKVERGQIDRSDARVQTLAQPVVVQSVRVERGERLTQAPDYVLPPKTEVVKRVGGRDIVSITGAAAVGAAVGAAAGYFIRSNDDERLAVDSRDRYVERLPRGRTRETIVRENGSQVVTISNEYGDVVQRSRITPEGREVVLFYDPYSEDDARLDYYDDPGEDLPPLELTIPRDRYIVDIDEPDEDLYYDTISAPPVETVSRIYSVDEVRRSSRIRDKVRRIDVNTINFDFGSAAISQAEVKTLQALADAVARVIKDNPGETFLIEGHTDAVGSNVANLALSDQRAEAVATALSQYFDIPAENLITQGYGEEDLKVKTQEPERQNRRVTLRRITSLVKPVRSADGR